MYSNLLIIGDINLHLDVRSDPHAIKFEQLLEAHDLSQHSRCNPQLITYVRYVLITRAEQTVNSVTVDPPALSDHTQIVGVLAARLPHPHTGTRQVRRCWRQLDLDELKHDIQQSVLVSDPPGDVDQFFTCYNGVLRSLLDKHAPVKSVVVRRHPQSPWFDGECRQMKQATRRLERRYRTTHSPTDYSAWHRELDSQRSPFQTTYAEYWRSAISESGHDARVLWSRVNSMLSPPAETSASIHTADDFVTYFGRKVEDIRTATSTATAPDIQFRPTSSLCNISLVSCSEVVKILSRMPAISCSLDPMPTWLVKKIQDILIPVICNLCNPTLRSAVFSRQSEASHRTSSAEEKYSGP